MKQYNKIRKLWVDRKRAVMGMLADMADSMDKKVSQVEEMFGVESDKAADVEIPPAIKQQRR